LKRLGSPREKVIVQPQIDLLFRSRVGLTERLVATVKGLSGSRR
jgi:hypothetical protein